uniref:Uncharacterized protein n=1 Tax=Romanomermis culicivorax TaxID=13658 RepID=A0A915IPE2_ROMCU
MQKLPICRVRENINFKEKKKISIKPEEKKKRGIEILPWAGAAAAESSSPSVVDAMVIVGAHIEQHHFEWIGVHTTLIGSSSVGRRLIGNVAGVNGSVLGQGRPELDLQKMSMVLQKKSTSYHPKKFASLISVVVLQWPQYRLQ